MEPIKNQETEDTIDPLYRNIFATAKMGGIAAFLSLAGGVAGAVAGLTMPATAVPLPPKEGFEEVNMQQLAQGSTYFFAIISLVISAIVFYFLFRFSRLAKSALIEGDSHQLSQALQSLAGYFKIWGILLFLIILFFGLSLLGGIFSGIAAG